MDRLFELRIRIIQYQQMDSSRNHFRGQAHLMISPAARVWDERGVRVVLFALIGYSTGLVIDLLEKNNNTILRNTVGV